MQTIKWIKIKFIYLLAASFIFSTSLAGGETVERDSNQRNIREKMEKIIIPRIDFEEATIHQVVSFLRQKSREHDPEGEGINIILHLRERERERERGRNNSPEHDKITLSLSEIPLGEVIRLICFVTDLKYYFESNAIIISDRELPEGELITRFYPVKSGIFRDFQPRDRDQDEDPWSINDNFDRW